MPNTSNGRWYQFPRGQFVPSVTTIVSGGSPMQPYLLKYHVNNANGDWDKYRKADSEATRVGTAIHKFIEVGLMDGKVSLDDYDIEIQKGIMSFLSWWNVNQYEVVELETFLYCDEEVDGKLRFPFCGTADAILRDSDGKLVLADWKSSKAISKGMSLQLSAYKLLWDATHDEKIDRCIVVHCKKDFAGAKPTRSFKPEHTMNFDPKSFEACYRLFRLFNETAKGELEPKEKHHYPLDFTFDVRNAKEVAK